ncbi:hydrolase [Lacticaseibacillus pabuli]|uniref:Hydrolase n=1 Tax=Lacticaseibacillus pabuli TaxID=3025672 RepID=A0ABY7WQR3_9LACO|nr:hydrolase [Lacticaseibacillus sp. KACC 23028]WDF82527.1 hydrolase [Lacticaseibacillus sp. KACC 23028]
MTIKVSHMKWLIAVLFAVVPGATIASATLPVNANNDQVAQTTTNDSASKPASDKAAADLAATSKKHNINVPKVPLATGKDLERKDDIKITPGTNAYNDARNQLAAEAKAKADAAAKAAAAAKAKAQAAAKAKAQAANAAKTSNNSAATPATTSGKSYGTFKLTFYDPAVLGSNMGYSGVAANLGVFPKGTHLKITLSTGQVWYRVVNDTGTFAASNSRQLDVAMPNSQVPSAGVLSATVEVV